MSGKHLVPRYRTRELGSLGSSLDSFGCRIRLMNLWLNVPLLYNRVCIRGRCRISNPIMFKDHPSFRFWGNVLQVWRTLKKTTLNIIHKSHNPVKRSIFSTTSSGNLQRIDGLIYVIQQHRISLLVFPRRPRRKCVPLLTVLKMLSKLGKIQAYFLVNK